MKEFWTNQKVTTPIGPGTVQGRYGAGYLVRVNLSATTKTRPSITPRAVISGLWEFKPEELK